MKIQNCKLNTDFGYIRKKLINKLASYIRPCFIVNFGWLGLERASDPATRRRPNWL